MPRFIYSVGSSKKTVEVELNKTILEIMQELGLDISFPCNGKHSCGKCKVLARGELSPMSDVERRMLGDQAPKDMRLACFTRILGDVEVDLPDSKHDDQIALRFSIMMKTLDPNYDGDYGFAVDIGTTTVVAYLFVKDSLWALAYDGHRNLQQRFGADVLSRIDYANRNGVEPLTKSIRSQLSELFLELCETSNISPEKIEKAVIAGNSVMLHLLDGLDPRSLAEAPFNMVSEFGEYADWQIEGFEQMETYLPRCIAAYVGADITCSMLAADLPNLSDGTILVDIGTNGEMALKADGKLLCCSTAAGPAFEGAGISSGMSAKPGAISKVWAENGKMYYETIDNEEARGVCGSGLIDAVSVANELGIINTRGKIVLGDGSDFMIGDSGIKLTQKDIRQLQMAKAAIRAGRDTNV
ncbi:MAG: ASKHA domain-containing protein, partial [Eubacteriales bacterium]|nr:ASKHA domain-containing protein [Eubacteriales bacterium]